MIKCGRGLAYHRERDDVGEPQPRFSVGMKS